MVGKISFPDIINRFASLVEMPTRNVVSRLAEVTESVTPEDLSRMSQLNELDLSRVNARCFDLMRTVGALLEDKNLDPTSKAITQIFVHDINNALSSSMGYSQFLSKWSYWDRQEAMGDYNRVFESVHRLLIIISQLKAYGMTATPEGFTLNRTDFDFPWAVHRAMERFGSNGPVVVYCDNKGIVDVNGRAYSRTERTESVVCFADPEMASFVVSNLVGNAVKYKHPSRDHVSVRIIYKTNGGKVHVSVEDDGIGIQPDKLDRVFEIGYRVPDTGVYGTGLGLPLVRTVIEAQGGHISVESEYGVGSTFAFTVPLSRQQFLFGNPCLVEPNRRVQEPPYDSGDSLFPPLKSPYKQQDLFIY